MKRTLCLATLLLSAVSLLTTSCGTGDKIGSVSISAVGASGSVINLSGLGATLQLRVTANYTSGKQIDETNFSTFVVTAQGVDNNSGQPLPNSPLTLTLNKTGMVTSVDPAACTWQSSTGDPTNPGWAFTGDYMIQAQYRGFTSNPIFIPIASAASNQAGLQGKCGPQ